MSSKPQRLAVEFNILTTLTGNHSQAGHLPSIVSFLLYYSTFFSFTSSVLATR
jgi:hypothetical protein